MRFFQWVIICDLFLGLVIHASMNGQENKSTYNFAVKLCVTGAILFVLCKAGTFQGFFN